MSLPRIARVALLALAGPVAAPAVAGDYAQTQYLLHCSGCHGGDGQGYIAKGIPPFPDVVGKFLLHPEGRNYLVNVGGSRTSAIGHAQRAAILNWIVETWDADNAPEGNRPFDESEVASLYERWEGDSARLRERIRADLLTRGIEVGPVRGD